MFVTLVFFLLVYYPTAMMMHYLNLKNLLWIPIRIQKC